MAGDVSRRNRARSRGPVTPEGKARSRRNALRHGLAAARGPDAGYAAAVAGPAPVLTGERRRRALERARMLGLPVEQGPEAGQGDAVGPGCSDNILTALSLAVADADLEVEAIERRKLALIEEATTLADLEATLRTQHHDALHHAPVARAQEPRPVTPQAQRDDEDAERALIELRTLSLPRPRRPLADVPSLGIGEPGGEGPWTDPDPAGRPGLSPANALAACADVADDIRRLDRYAIRAEGQRRRAWRELQLRLHKGPPKGARS